MKNVLVISYYFPPAGGPGVQRVGKHVKYLREWGYNPIVITATPDDYTRCSGLSMPLDESLARDIPAGTEVHRVPSHQPFRVFELLRRLRLEYLREFFFIPDSALTWIIPVILEARRIARAKPIDLIYTSVKPHSVAITGWVLRHLLARPWIIDFRDPWTQYFLATFPTRLHYGIERLLESTLLRQADHVITITPTARENLLQWCTFLAPDKVSCVANGYDEEDFVRQRIDHAGNGVFTFVYAGVFCGGPSIKNAGSHYPLQSSWRWLRNHLAYAPRHFDRMAHSPKFFLDALKALFKERPDLRGRIRLTHAGPFSEENERYAKELGLETVIDARGYQPHAEALRCLEQGDAAFLCLADSPTGERNDCVPQKVYEYLGTRKPVLALLPYGDARDILERAGTALVCSPRDVEAIKRSLLALVENRWHTQPNERFIAGFQRQQLTARLAGIFDHTLVGRIPEPQPGAFTTMLPATSSSAPAASLPSGRERNHKTGDDER
jgi:glycosyltransferase involved in cell wall biosynthesis